MKKHNLLSNVLNFTFIQSLNYIFPLLVIPIIITRFGLEFYGDVAFTQNVGQFILVIALFGMDQYGVKKVIESKDLYVDCMSIQSIRFILFFIFLSIAFVLLMHDFIKIIVFILLLGTVSQSLQPIWYFQGQSKLIIVVLSNLAGKALSLALIFLSNTEFDLVLGLSLQFMLPIILLNYFMYRDFTDFFKKNESNFTLVAIKDNAIGAIDYFQTSLFSTILTSSSLFFVGIFSDEKASVGLFAIIDRVFKTASKVFSIFSNSLYPISCEKAKDGFDTLCSYTFKKAKVTLFIYVVIVIFLLTLSPFIIDMLGWEFKDYVISVAIVLSIWLFFGILNNFLGIQILMSYGKVGTYKEFLFISGICSLVLMVILGYIFKDVGVITAIAIGESVLSLLLIKRVLRGKNENWCNV